MLYFLKYVYFSEFLLAYSKHQLTNIPLYRLIRANYKSSSSALFAFFDIL